MPEAILKFTLPEEDNEFKMATQASDLVCILKDFDNESLRKRIKYEEDTPEIVAVLREELWKIIAEYNCSEIFE
jgi:hypothetical protein